MRMSDDDEMSQWSKMVLRKAASNVEFIDALVARDPIAQRELRKQCTKDGLLKLLKPLDNYDDDGRRVRKAHES